MILELIPKANKAHDMLPYTLQCLSYLVFTSLYKRVLTFALLNPLKYASILLMKSFAFAGFLVRAPFVQGFMVMSMTISRSTLNKGRIIIPLRDWSKLSQRVVLILNHEYQPDLALLGEEFIPT